MSTTKSIIDRANLVLIGNYARQPVVMAKGQGSELWDADGRRYVDLFAGFGGTVLGHAHPALVEAARRQAETLWAVGNSYYTLPQIDVAEAIKRNSFDGRAFFCHSGLEANEAAVKLARLRGGTHAKKKWKVVSFHRSFHGRSLAMISATGNPAVKAGFEPLVPGFSQVEMGDMEGLTAAVDDETAAILVEPIQGEGGINPVPTPFAIEMRKLCDARQVTLIFDEVWCCGGRTGKWFGHQHFTDAFGKVVEPDIMTLGKAVGGGAPVGVMWAKPELAALMTPGKHGCTLGANPLCMNIAKALFEVIEKEKLVEYAGKMGDYAMDRLRAESSIAGKIQLIRGKGLFFGIELKEAPNPASKFGETALKNGVIINITSQKIIRVAPAINIPKNLLDEGIDRLISTIREL